MSSDPIRTERLVLRSVESVDLDAFAAMFADPEVLRYVGGDGSPATRAETAEWIERTVRRNGLDGWDRRSVLRADDGLPLGWCGASTHLIEGRAEPELGYVLGREHWGLGYATEAATAMRDHAHAGLGIRRLIALIAFGNDASERVAEKLGFTYERDVEFHGRPTKLFAHEV